MSDIICKVQRSAEILQSRSLSARQKVDPALQALSGLTLSDLNEVSKAAFEVELVAVNRIFAAAGIEEEADYQKLAETDASDILSHVGAAGQLCIDSEVKRVMDELDGAGRKLPVAAIKEVRQHPDLFVPLLMRSLEQAIQRIRNGNHAEGDAAFFAVFLLTELKITESFPLILDGLRLPGEGPFELLGDGVHNLTAPLLALFCAENTGPIDEIVLDPDVNHYVRWAAANAYLNLVRDERVSRQDAIDILHRHFQQFEANADYEMLAPLACELGDLAAKSALETIRSAFQQELVDESIVTLDFIESQVAAGEDTVKKELAHCRPTGMPDTIAELSGWWAFSEERSVPQPRSVPTPVPRPHASPSDFSPSPATKTIRGSHTVGRNDPCPCGSGKKFKKCCRRLASDV